MNPAGFQINHNKGLPLAAPLSLSWPLQHDLARTLPGGRLKSRATTTRASARTSCTWPTSERPSTNHGCHRGLFVRGSRSRLACFLTCIVEKRRRSPAVLRRAHWVLDNYLLPALGARPIPEITAHELLGVLNAIERRGLLDTVRRVRQQASRILQHAVGLGRIPYDFTEDFRGLLLPPVTRHHPGITNPKRLGELSA